MNERDLFGERMKSYERESESKLDLTQPVVVRIDGKRFSKYTKKLEKPFDLYLYSVFNKTVSAVIDELHADVAYFQSDEITFVFLPKKDTGKVSIPFEGRIQKLASVCASMFTSHFVNVLNEVKCEESCPQIGMNVLDVPHTTPYFDARVFNVPSVGEAANAITWRISDCMKNYPSSVFRQVFGHKAMQNLSGSEMMEKLENSDKYHYYGDMFMYGTLYHKRFFNRTNDVGVEYIRSEYYVMFGNIFFDLNFEKKVKFLEDIINKNVYGE